MNILHVITGLNDGGAESLLFNVINGNSSCKHIVVSMTGRGKYGDKFSRMGVLVYTLNITGFCTAILAALSLFRIIKVSRPNVVQTWLYHADFFGGLVAKLFTKTPVVWSIHNSKLLIGKSKVTTILICKINSILSYFLPKKIICCAKYSEYVHTSMGYCQNKFVIIPNGYDSNKYIYSCGQRDKIRDQLAITSNLILIGMVARFDPIKGHDVLIKAACRLRHNYPEVRYALVGTNCIEENTRLTELISNFGVSDIFQLLGPSSDMESLYSAFDITVLPSLQEAFPNVLAESMLVGVPCVTTTVGDASLIVDEYGWTCSPNNVAELEYKLRSALNIMTDSKKWSDLKQKCRKHIEVNFNLQLMIDRYNALWASVSRD